MYFHSSVILHLVVQLLFRNVAMGKYLTRYKRVTVTNHVWPSYYEVATFEKGAAGKGKMEIQGKRLESMGCWRDAWNRAVTPLEGRHYLLMDPNYKTRSHALFKCALAALDNQLKVFGIENGGQCMGNSNAENAYRKHGPATECRVDGKGGPWSLQVYRFTDSPVRVVDGNYSDWSNWTPCTKTCGKGIQTRMRKCSHPAPAYGGEDCSRLGPSVESAACNANLCSEDISLGEPEFTNTASQNPKLIYQEKPQLTATGRQTTLDSQQTADTEQQTALNNEKAADTRHSGRKLVPLSNGRVTLSGVAHQSAHDNSVLSNKGFNKPINDFEFNTETKEEGNSEKIVPVDIAETGPSEQNSVKELSIVSTAASREAGKNSDQDFSPLTSSDKSIEEELGTDGSQTADAFTVSEQSPSDSVHPNSKSLSHISKVGPALHTAVLTAEAESQMDQPLQNHRPPLSQTKSEMKPLVSVTTDQVRAGSTSQGAAGATKTPATTSECLCPSKVCEGRGEIGFLVDSSSIVPGAEFIRALQLVKALSRGFEGKETQIGLVAYGGEAKKAFDLETPPDFQQLDALIDTASYIGGDTKTGNALLKAQNALFAQKARNDAPKALILVSSGGSTDDVTAPSSDIRDSGVRITAVGLGKLARVNELINVASEPKSEHVFTAFFERDTLPRTIDGIVQAVCKDILGELKDQKEQCTCDNNQSPPPAVAYGKPPTGPVQQAQSKVKYAGVAQQSALNRPYKLEAEPIVLSVPEETIPSSLQAGGDQKSNGSWKVAASKPVLSLPQPMLPVVFEEDSQNGTIPSLPTDGSRSHADPQQPGITAVPGIPHKSNRKMNKEGTQSSTEEYQDCAVNLGVLLDGSATVEGYGKGNFKRLQQFVKTLSRSFPVSQHGNHLGLVVYSSEPKPVFGFQRFSDQASVDEAIDSVSFPSREAMTGKALAFAAQRLFSRSTAGKDVLLLITDGPSFDDVTQPAIELKRRGVEVFCLGVGQGYAKNQLEMIASDPVSEHVFTAPFKGAESGVGKVRDGICRAAKNTDDSIAFSPPNKKTFIAKLHAANPEFNYDSQVTYTPKRRGHLYHLLNDVIR